LDVLVTKTPTARLLGMSLGHEPTPNYLLFG